MLVVASKYLTAVVLTCQLYCLNKSILMVGFHLYLILFQPHSFGADGPSHILQFIPGPFKTLLVADYREKQLGFTKYWSLQSSEAYCADLAPGRQQLSSAKRWEVFFDNCSFRVALTTEWQGIVVGKNCGTEHKGLAFNLKLNQKPSLETCWYQSYRSARARLKKGGTLSNI